MNTHSDRVCLWLTLTVRLKTWTHLIRAYRCMLQPKLEDLMCDFERTAEFSKRLHSA